MVALLGVVLLVVLLGVVVKGCRNTQADNALKDYNRQVASITTESAQTGTEFFKLFGSSQPPAGQELESSINSAKAGADKTLQQAQGLSVPDPVAPAQQSLLIALELRRDALAAIASEIRTALGDSGQQADAAINDMAGQMSAFSASDVLYRARVVPFIKAALAKREIGAQPDLKSDFLHDVSWLSPQFIATKLDQQLSSGTATGTGKNQPTGPGLHGTGLNSTTVGNQTLQPAVANNIAFQPGQTFMVAFTNQGDNDEFNVKVTLRIEGSSSSPITLTANVPKVAKGAKATVPLKLNRTPPLNTALTIRVTVAAVPGEKKTDNNKSAYPARFTRG
jgi:hypothetical protein